MRQNDVGGLRCTAGLTGLATGMVRFGRRQGL